MLTTAIPVAPRVAPPGQIAQTSSIDSDEVERIAAHFESLAERVSKVEERAAAAIVYKGVWSGSETYAIADSATHAGSLWVCQKANCGNRPGATDCWVLAVKRGHAAR